MRGYSNLIRFVLCTATLATNGLNSFAQETNSASEPAKQTAHRFAVKVDLNYLLYLPKDYQKAEAKK